MALVEGVDLYLLLEDLAATKKRVTILEEQRAFDNAVLHKTSMQRMTQSKPCRVDPIKSGWGI